MSLSVSLPGFLVEGSLNHTFSFLLKRHLRGGKRVGGGIYYFGFSKIRNKLMTIIFTSKVLIKNLNKKKVKIFRHN